jgi:hypothetical protein
MALIALSGVAHAAFLRSFLYLTIQLNDDGSASVKEELRFFMSDADSVELYKVSLRSTNDLAGWRSRTALTDIRYHLDTSEVTIFDTRLQPLDPDTCDVAKQTCYGTFITEYKVASPADGKGLVNISRGTKPRITEYRIKPGAFSFEQSAGDTIYLPERSTLEIRLPEGSRITSASPTPVEGSELGEASKLTWQGGLLMAGFNLAFEKKQSLSAEVNEFFGSIGENSVGWLLSREGLALSAAAVLLIVGYLMLRGSK